MAEKERRVHPRKTQITQAAVACFIEKGYHQTGVRDIAQRAGVSLGNLYNHFKGKEAILVFIAELEDRDVSGFAEMLSDPTAPQAALDRFIIEYTTYAARPENALLSVEILTEALRNPTIAEVFGKNRKRLIGALVECLQTGAAAGVFASDIDETLAACMILDTLEGNGLRGLASKPDTEQTSQSLRDLILRCVCT